MYLDSIEDEFRIHDKRIELYIKQQCPQPARKEKESEKTPLNVAEYTFRKPERLHEIGNPIRKWNQKKYLHEMFVFEKWFKNDRS